MLIATELFNINDNDRSKGFTVYFRNVLSFSYFTSKIFSIPVSINNLCNFGTINSEYMKIASFLSALLSLKMFVIRSTKAAVVQTTWIRGNYEMKAVKAVNVRPGNAIIIHFEIDLSLPGITNTDETFLSSVTCSSSFFLFSFFFFFLSSSACTFSAMFDFFLQCLTCSLQRFSCFSRLCFSCSQFAAHHSLRYERNTS